MTIKSGIANTTSYVQQYINTAYDEVKTVYDNIASIISVHTNISSVVSVAGAGDLATLETSINSFLATPTAGMKSTVVCTTSANITLANLQTVDGIALAAGERVLVKNQTVPAENGIYIVVDGGAWTRATDFDGSITGDVIEGTSIPVARGTLENNTWWNVTNQGTITIGSTGLTFIQAIDANAAAASAAAAASSASAAATSESNAAAFDIGLVCTEEASPVMTVAVGAGHIQSWGHLTIAATSTGTITAPTTNPRIDRVAIDVTDGTVVVITGTEAASPVAPDYANNHYPLCQVALATSTTSIVNALITDERVLGWAAPNVIGADVASASTLVLGTDGNIFSVTGTTQIDEIGPLGVGTIVTLLFTTTIKLSSQVINLPLNGGDMYMLNGDSMTLWEYAPGDWKTLSVYRRNAQTNQHNAAGNTQIVDGSVPSGSEFELSAVVAEGVWKTVGTTNSSPDYVWTDMDVIPRNATILIVNVNLQMSTSGAGPAIVNVYCTEGDDTTPGGGNNNRLISHTVDMDAIQTGFNQFFWFPIYIPIGVNNQKFNISWSMSGENTGGGVGFQYRGFITD